MVPHHASCNQSTVLKQVFTSQASPKRSKDPQAEGLGESKGESKTSNAEGAASDHVAPKPNDTAGVESAAPVTPPPAADPTATGESKPEGQANPPTESQLTSDKVSGILRELGKPSCSDWLVQLSLSQLLELSD